MSAFKNRSPKTCLKDSVIQFPFAIRRTAHILLCGRIMVTKYLRPALRDSFVHLMLRSLRRALQNYFEIGPTSHHDASRIVPPRHSIASFPYRLC